MNLLRNRWFALIASMAAGYLGMLLFLYMNAEHPERIPDRPSILLAFGLVGIPFGPIYFLPTIIGLHKRNALAICILNGFLGLTGVGWVAALIWAVLKDGNSQAPISARQEENYYEPRG